MAGKTSFERITPKRAERRHRIAIVAFDDVVLADLSVPGEVFGRVRTAAGTPAYEIRVCSPVARVSSEFVNLTVPFRMRTLRWADTVIVPGKGGELARPVPNVVLAEIARAVRRGARVASICTGAFILAATGALDGLRATTHWLAAAELARRFPKVRVDPDVLYVDDGRIATSAGAAAGLDLCLHLVRRDLGAEIAARTARAVVMPLERAGGQAQFIVHEPPALGPSALGKLLDWIPQNLAADLSLAALARRVAMSVRTFCRRFREQVGATPAAWIVRVRLTRAQRLLETTRLSIEEVAEAVGFRSTTVLREHFARTLGTSPRAYRRSMSIASSELSLPEGAVALAPSGRDGYPYRAPVSGSLRAPSGARRRRRPDPGR